MVTNMPMVNNKWLTYGLISLDINLANMPQTPQHKAASMAKTSQSLSEK
jgi:hypothetical protein